MWAINIVGSKCFTSFQSHIPRNKEKLRINQGYNLIMKILIGNDDAWYYLLEKHGVPVMGQVD